MRASNLFFPTLRDVPADAELVSHQLLVRGGFLQRLAAGIYSYLPLGYRVVKKVAQIVREEMDAAGAQELLLPVVQPADLWRETGRLDEYGDTLAKLRDRRSHELCLGPTHEEVITDIVRHHVHSYRDLPLLLYQVQTKFRDEPRPRGGLIRGREFIMKDAYSFDVDEDSMERSYQAMCRAYCRAFTRCGLDYQIVEAEAGVIGGSENLEFMIVAEAGEDRILCCLNCDYAANLECAERHEPMQVVGEAYDARPLEEVSTPDQKIVDQVTKFLNIDPEGLVKTLLFISDGEPVATLVRGDTDINEVKLQHVLGAAELKMADGPTIEHLTGAPVGYTGPVGLKGVKIVADFDVREMSNFVTGANLNGKHLINVNPDRDFEVEMYADLRFAGSGDGCPKCKGVMEILNCIEIGHIFKLGTRYSEAMSAYFTNENGKEAPLLMGCYGIGISRIVATAVEVGHDDDGMNFPISIAPYECWIVVIDGEDEFLREAAEGIYYELLRSGVEVVLDERDERPGVKFKDADLIGVPIQVVVGRKLREGEGVEVRARANRNGSVVQLEEVTSEVLRIRADAFARSMPNDGETMGASLE